MSYVGVYGWMRGKWRGKKMNLLVRLVWVRWLSTRQLELNPSGTAKDQAQSHSGWGQGTKAWVDTITVNV